MNSKQPYLQANIAKAPEMTALPQCFCKHRLDIQEFTQAEGTVSIAKQHSQRCIFSLLHLTLFSPELQLCGCFHD